MRTFICIYSHFSRRGSRLADSFAATAMPLLAERLYSGGFQPYGAAKFIHADAFGDSARLLSYEKYIHFTLIFRGLFLHFAYRKLSSRQVGYAVCFGTNHQLHQKSRHTRDCRMVRSRLDGGLIFQRLFTVFPINTSRKFLNIAIAAISDAQQQYLKSSHSRERAECVVSIKYPTQLAHHLLCAYHADGRISATADDAEVPIFSPDAALHCKSCLEAPIVLIMLINNFLFWMRAAYFILRHYALHRND